jgi:hypothetical protein
VTNQYTIAADGNRSGRYSRSQTLSADCDVIRNTRIYDVLRTRNASRISIASPQDFVCRRHAEGVPPQSQFPYCLDFLRRRALYVTDLDAKAVQAAPFYYLYLRGHARRVLSVPFAASGAGADPVFLFSPGRCGSTLMSRVLFEAGIASVSEPDFYTQLGSWLWSRPFNPLAGVYRDAMWKMSQDLAAGLGAVPVVKLRAECARAPELFVRNPAASSLVLFRRFETWSRSTAQVFGASPEKAVRKYLTALKCYAWLRRHSRCLAIRYEDWLTDPAAAAGNLGSFLGQPIGLDAVARALGRQSQAGTPLERCRRSDWQAKWDGALRLWQSPRLVTARDRLDLPNVWD